VLNICKFSENQRGESRTSLAGISENVLISNFRRVLNVHAPTCPWRWNRVFRNVGI